MNKKHNNNVIFNLIKKYSLILITTIIIFMVFVIIQQVVDNYQKHDIKLRETSSIVSQYYRQDNQRMTQLSLEMFKNEDLIEPYHALFDLPYEDYLWWNIENSLGRENRDISTRFKKYMSTDESIKAVTIELIDYEEVFYIERGRTAGQKIDGVLDVDYQYKIDKPLIDQTTFDVVGTVTFYLSDNLYKESLKTSDDFSIYSIYLLNKIDDVVMSLGNTNQELETYMSGIGKGITDLSEIESSLEDYKIYYVALPNGFTSIVAALKKDMYFSDILPIIFWLIAGLTMIGSLIYLLKSMFKSYMYQVDDMVKVVNSIQLDDTDYYINIEDKEGELLLISNAINDMLSDIKRYINDIYGLEIRQKDAELRALQAQINPHFMYNTLEYIRMNVLSEGLEDLSEVIYSFATLLRNNIAAEKFITLKNELDFCEKYVFLYQIRHPDRIAYKFYLSNEMEKMVLPRFIIQPLIENYLIHGLDYRRIDNAISVSAYKSNGTSTIIIKDNGKGIHPDKLETIQELLLVEKEISDYGSDSIGIMNVHERLKFYYKGNATLTLKENYPSGLIATIEIRESEEYV